MCCCSWLNTKGLKARARGMKKKESKQRKWAICVFFAFSFIFSLLLCAIHLDRFINAIYVSSEFNYLLSANETETYAYNTCRIPEFRPYVNESVLERL